MGHACAVNCTMGAALIFLGFCLVPGMGFAGSSGGTHDTVEKSIPQGKDSPATDDEQRPAPPAEHKGVITPPPVGDEGFYTKVPNPGLVIRCCSYLCVALLMLFADEPLGPPDQGRFPIPACLFSFAARRGICQGRVLINRDW
jgi:hypothetical protein